jgi:hypothetical protein
LDEENRRRALVVLATKFGVDRERVQGLLQHYSSLKPVEGAEDETEETASDCGVVAARYRVERDLRAALVPLSSRLFDQINGQAGGLKFLVDLRADLKASLQYDDSPYHNLSAAAPPINLTILIVNLSRSHIPSSGLRCRVL